MGLFEWIFGKKPSEKTVMRSPEFKALTVYSPTFTNANLKLYEQEIVRTAIGARAVHVSKLRVEFYGHGAQALEQRLRRPNAFQTWSQFLYRTSTILDNNNTVVILPIMDSFGRITEIYPVLPQRSKMVEVNGEPWVACEFASGRYAQVPAYKAAILTRYQYRNDFFGESNAALFPTLKLIDIQNQGITEGIKSAATYRFMAQMSNFAKAEDLRKERKRFDENNFTDEGGGLLLFPNTYTNIQQIDSKPYVIDDKQMEIIRKNVFEYFGVNEDILQNKAYGDSWTAFYEGAIEPFAIQFSEALSAMFLLTGNLTGDAGIYATANRLQYMSNAEKLNVSSQLADRGVLNRDEVREIWNLAPLPDGQGKEYIIRGEYANADEKINGGQTDAS